MTDIDLALDAVPSLEHPSARLIFFDQLPYKEGWALQRYLVEARLDDRIPDTLLLLEHDPVYTVGRSGRPEHWAGVAARKAVYHVERGGSVTYHGPGQLVGYPILKLAQYCSGPRSYVRLLEEVILRTAADWGIAATRVEKLPGVWTAAETPRKLASIGVRITRGVTMHGFALNVAVDLAAFDMIVPCGLTSCPVTSMTEILGQPLAVAKVRRRLAARFAEVFQLEWQEEPSDTLLREVSLRSAAVFDAGGGT